MNPNDDNKNGQSQKSAKKEEQNVPAEEQTPERPEILPLDNLLNFSLDKEPEKKESDNDQS